MKKFLSTAWILIFGITLNSARAAPPAVPDSGRTGPLITVRVYDYAGVGDNVRAGAVQTSTRILQKAGVELRWLDCPMNAGMGPTICDGRLAPTDLVLRFVRRTAATPAVFRRTHCGFATRDERGIGAFASIFIDCLDDLPDSKPLPTKVVLGHLIAHEIGHLLLSSEGHSAAGIMRARFRRAEWQLAAIGALVFAPREAELMQAELKRRKGERELEIGSRTRPPVMANE